MTFSISNSDLHGRSQVTLIDDDGQVYTFTGESPIFGDLSLALLSGDFDEARRLATSGRTVRDNFLALSDHITIQGDDVMYDGEPMYGRLAENIMEFHTNGWGVDRLVKFAERIAANPSYNSRGQLYEFLDRYDFVITKDGHFIAYKGVTRDGRSIHAGYGVVDGVEYQRANLPNSEGSLVQIPREMVDDNVNAGCSVGLHVGTWDYASNFGQGMTLKVEVDPADVVSVPHDVSYQKVRVTQYLVLEATEQEIDPDAWYQSDNDWDEDEWDEEDWDEDEEHDIFLEDLEQDMLSDLQMESASYTLKGRMGNSYVQVFERIYDRPLYEDEREIAEDFDNAHTALAVYRYHVDRLLDRRMV